MTPVIKIMRGQDRSITDCIHEGRIEFEMATGDKPRRVILGHIKWFQLQDEMDDILRMIGVSCIGPSVPTYDGLEIHRRTQPGMTIE
jgi:hypothetical protein